MGQSEHGTEISKPIRSEGFKIHVVHNVLGSQKEDEANCYKNIEDGEENHVEKAGFAEILAGN